MLKTAVLSDSLHIHLFFFLSCPLIFISFPFKSFHNHFMSFDFLSYSFSSPCLGCLAVNLLKNKLNVNCTIFISMKIFIGILQGNCILEPTNLYIKTTVFSHSLYIYLMFISLPFMFISFPFKSFHIYTIFFIFLSLL